jgi:hypothetical protein
MCGCVLVLLVQQKIENKSVVVWKKAKVDKTINYDGGL